MKRSATAKLSDLHKRLCIGPIDKTQVKIGQSYLHIVSNYANYGDRNAEHRATWHRCIVDKATSTTASVRLYKKGFSTVTGPSGVRKVVTLSSLYPYKEEIEGVPHVC